MRNIYNLAALIERYGFSAGDVERFIACGLLMPRGWETRDDPDRARMVADGFSYAEWPAEELERFDNIIRLIHKNYNIFYTKLGLDLHRIESSVNDNADYAREKLNQLINMISLLSEKIDLQDSWLSLNEFCEITGYKCQTCYNNIKMIDADLPTMRLDLDIYNKLVWHKRGKSWQTKFRDFKEIRKNFYYELYLEEEKRTGKYTAPLKVTLDDLK